MGVSGADIETLGLDGEGCGELGVLRVLGVVEYLGEAEGLDIGEGKDSDFIWVAGGGN